MTDNEFRAIAAYVRQAGYNAQSDAGYSGAMHDGGGGALIKEADAFVAGLERRLPTGWEKYASEVKKEADPEYAQYMRLKRKFE